MEKDVYKRQEHYFVFVGLSHWVLCSKIVQVLFTQHEKTLSLIHIYNKFGWNKANGDGIIYVDDWATGYTWMCTTGLAKTRLDDTDTEQIVDSANEIVNDNPYEAYTSIVNNAATMIQTGRSSYCLLYTSSSYIFLAFV